MTYGDHINHNADGSEAGVENDDDDNDNNEDDNDVETVVAVGLWGSLSWRRIRISISPGIFLRVDILNSFHRRGTLFLPSLTLTHSLVCERARAVKHGACHTRARS